MQRPVPHRFMHRFVRSVIAVLVFASSMFINGFLAKPVAAQSDTVTGPGGDIATTITDQGTGDPNTLSAPNATAEVVDTYAPPGADGTGGPGSITPPAQFNGSVSNATISGPVQAPPGWTVGGGAIGTNSFTVTPPSRLPANGIGTSIPLPQPPPPVVTQVNTTTGGDGYGPLCWPSATQDPKNCGPEATRFYNIYHHSAEPDPNQPGLVDKSLNCRVIGPPTTGCSGWPADGGWWWANPGSDGSLNGGQVGVFNRLLFTHWKPQVAYNNDRIYSWVASSQDFFVFNPLWPVPNAVGVGCFDPATNTSCGFTPVATPPTAVTSAATPFGWSYFWSGGVKDPATNVFYGFGNSGDNSGVYNLFCVDLDTMTTCPLNGTPLAATAWPWPSAPRDFPASEQVIWQNRIYTYIENDGAGAPPRQLTCITTAGGACPGAWPQNLPNTSGYLVLYPHFTTTGVQDGVCAQNNCYNAAGGVIPAPALTFAAPPINALGYVNVRPNGPNGGVRTYFAERNGIGPSGGWTECWDWTTGSHCVGFGGVPAPGVTNHPNINAGETIDYDMASVNGCLASLGDSGFLYTLDPATGASPICRTAQPAQVRIQPQLSYCDGRTDHVRGWRSASVDGNPADYQQILVTVRDANGNPVPGFVDVPMVNNSLDLSSIPYAGNTTELSFDFSVTASPGADPWANDPYVSVSLDADPYQTCVPVVPVACVVTVNSTWAAVSGFPTAATAPIAVPLGDGCVAINIVKRTNGIDTTTDPPPFIPVGSPITWTYQVTNTGEITLTDVTVTDNRLAPSAIDCGSGSNVIASLAAGASVSCTANGTATAGAYTNTGTVVGQPPPGFGPPVTDDHPSAYFGSTPGVSIVKRTNGVDTVGSPRPTVLVGDPITWTYQVTNTGNVTLTNVTVTDNQLAPSAIDCGSGSNVVPSLAAGASVTCTANGVATSGDYDNTGTVVGDPPVGPPVTDDHPSEYFGGDPDVSLVKRTNGIDTTVDPQPIVRVGDPITWTYQVTNTGNLVLTNVTVTDNRIPATQISCPGAVQGTPNVIASLAVGASVTCTANGTAVGGQYTNTGTVQVPDPPVGPPITVDHPSEYFGADPGIRIVKTTNGYDIETSPRPVFAVGTPVTWTYEVTNTGNLPLADVTVTDDKFPAAQIACAGSDPASPNVVSLLDPGKSVTCTATGNAVIGTYDNVGIVVGDPVCPTTPPPNNTAGAAAAAFGALTQAADDPCASITDDHPGGYFGGQPNLDIVKTTNGVDTTKAPAPQVQAGAAVTWTYLVTNTGNLTLNDVAVTDDKEGPITCPKNTLAAGESMTCIQNGTAKVGNYENIGVVVGTPACPSMPTPTTTTTQANGAGASPAVFGALAQVLPDPCQMLTADYPSAYIGYPQSDTPGGGGGGDNPGGGPGLPYTGARVQGIALTGVGLLIGGVSLVLFGRRRRIA